MSKQEFTETFDNSIKRGILREGDSVWVGHLFPYIVSVKNEKGDNILFVPRQALPTEFSFNKDCVFPYGFVFKNGEKYGIDISFSGFIRHHKCEKFFCDAFTSKENGIECISYGGNLEEFFHLRFSKEIMVEYRGENDFPVLMLPAHDVYEVE